MRKNVKRVVPVGLFVAWLILLAGCRGPGNGGMVHIPPPPRWEQSLTDHRQARDRQYRTDPDSPIGEEMRASFAGLDYFPTTEGLYFVGPIRYYVEPERFTILSTAGEPRPCEKVGWVGFSVDGTMQTLQVYRLLDSQPVEGGAGFFLPFMDATTGNETYAAGRYIDLIGPAGGPFVLDFNTAKNPLCAYGSPERYACPKTPAENRLSVRIEAGEKGWMEKPVARAEAGNPDS